MDWINLAQDRSRWLAGVSTVMYCRVLQNEENFFADELCSSSRRTVLGGIGYYGARV